jgi:hypothetical protein
MSTRSVHSLSTALKLLLTVATLMLGLVGTAAVASAWHADVTAQVDCHGAVSYTATAWDHATANPDIEIAFSSHGTAGPWTFVTVGAFNKADNFSFAGTFSPTPNTPGTTITVRAKALKPWVGQTAVEDSPHYADAVIPAQCSVPSAATVTLPCPSGVVFGKAVTFTAAAMGGVTPYTFQWTLNGHATGTASSTLTLVLTSSTDLVSVAVTDSNRSTATASASCPGSYPVPTVSMSCPAGFTYGSPATWTATATPGIPGDKLSYRWTVDGTPVGSNSPSVTTILRSLKNVLAITVTESFRDGKTSASSATKTCIDRRPVLIPPIQIKNTPPVPVKVVTVAAVEAVPAAATPTATLPFTGSHMPQQLALAAGLLAAGLILLRLGGKPTLRVARTS